MCVPLASLSRENVATFSWSLLKKKGGGEGGVLRMSRVFVFLCILRGTQQSYLQHMFASSGPPPVLVGHLVGNVAHQAPWPFASSTSLLATPGSAPLGGGSGSGVFGAG